MVLFVELLAPVCVAKEKQDKGTAGAVVSTQKQAFQVRHKQIKELIKKYKKAPLSQQPAIKEELAQVVGVQVDAQLEYMKEHIAAERANLDNWEKKIKDDQSHLAEVKAQRVEDLLSGEAQKKQKAAKKAWKKQMRVVKK